MRKNKYKLGRTHVVDERDQAYPMRALLDNSGVVRNQIWLTGVVLDQGNSPHCVGYAGAQYLMTSEAAWHKAPLPQGITGDVLYYDCKAVDKEPKAEDGSTGRSLVKVLKALGYVQSYHWATTQADIIEWVSKKGPVIVGTPWLSDMFNPDSKGYLRCTGVDEGGHEWLVHGVFPDKAGNAILKMCNSWGRGWGVAGHAYIKASDLWALIKKGGDCVGVIRTLKRD